VLAPAERPAQGAILAERGPLPSPGGDRFARPRLPYFFFGAGAGVVGALPVKVPFAPGLTV
jgi:hypothetical protein